MSLNTYVHEDYLQWGACTQSSVPHCKPNFSQSTLTRHCCWLQVAPFDLLDSLEQLDMDLRQVQQSVLALPVQKESSTAAQEILSMAGKL